MDKTVRSIDSHGFTMIEVLLVLSLTSFLGIFVMQLMKDSASATALSEAKYDELELARQLQLNLTYKPSCEKNLTGKAVDSLSVQNIADLVDSNGKKIIEKGQVVGNRSLKVEDLQFEITPAALQAYNDFKAAWPAGVTSYLMDVQFKLKTEKLKTAMGGKELNRIIPVKVKVDATNMITECFSADDASNATAMSNFCAQLGGTYNAQTNVCDFNPSCTATTPSQLIPAKCVDEKVAAAVDALNKAIADLQSRIPAAVAAASPSPSPSATPDPYALPFSPTHPGPGCNGPGCYASDYGPCEGTNCKTNGGTCKGINCQAGVVTGVVQWDGINMYTPSNPGPGCSGPGCHAADYGPCTGTNCTTNGGSCQGINCRTGVNN